MNEFERVFRLDTIGTVARSVSIAADNDECSALATRFGLVALSSLGATATLVQQGSAIIATGHFEARLIQSCITTAADVPTDISEPFTVRFVAVLGATGGPDEIELLADDCDTVEHDGQAVDLGEAVAQSLGLALDPFPRSARAADVLRGAGVVTDDELASGPFAVLKGLIKTP